MRLCETHSIETLQQLNALLDNLYHGIGRHCRECQDLDCAGYIWLLREEADRLYEQGIPLVQVNNGPMFIHSFPTTTEGVVNVSVHYPLCHLRSCNRGCSIYQDRPLVCRLYPLGLETKMDGTITWALHGDCLYLRWLKERGLLPDFQRRAQNIINGLSQGLLKEIVDTYREVDAICLFPNGENNYCSIQEVSSV